MPFLGSRRRLATGCKTLPVLAGFSLLAFLPTWLEKEGGWINLRPFLAIVLALASLVVVLALTLSSLCVRQGFGRIRFLFWVVAWTLLAWDAIAAPFVIYGSFRSEIDWGASVLALLYIWALTLALLLPLVLLSFFQPLYQSRFMAFLQPQPPRLPSQPTVPPKVSQVA